jgi:hypothetical protein
MNHSDHDLESRQGLPSMATARSSQAHDKRVQKIAEDAAAKIAADSPLEEEVVVVVEELPPGESARTQRSRSAQAAKDGAESMAGMVAQGQNFLAEYINRWIDLTSVPFGMPVASGEAAFGGFFDARRLTEQGFRLAEELLGSQKECALKVVEAMTPSKAA